ncbi:MAG TPA: hypothetical protein VF533_24080 [Solirubrobacteraceae bacterium]|jgi:hypothetical protein
MAPKKKPPSEPLRGEAAYLARKAEIAKRNDAAQARGAVRREERDTRGAERRLAAERREATNLPEQPGR